MRETMKACPQATSCTSRPDRSRPDCSKRKTQCFTSTFPHGPNSRR
jgi:hypothetical protein